MIKDVYLFCKTFLKGHCRKVSIFIIAKPCRFACIYLNEEYFIRTVQHTGSIIIIFIDGKIRIFSDRQHGAELVTVRTALQLGITVSVQKIIRFHQTVDQANIRSR